MDNNDYEVVGLSSVSDDDLALILGGNEPGVNEGNPPPVIVMPPLVITPNGPPPPPPEVVEILGPILLEK